MSKLKRPKAHKQPKILSPQQQRLLLDAFSQRANLRDTTLILLVLKTGLKSGEACQLNVSDVLLSSKVVDMLEVRAEITTNRSARHLPLSEEIQKAIKDFIAWKQENGESLAPGAPLFCTVKTKKRLIPRDFQRMMQTASDILGERVTANDLRHTFGSELYRDRDGVMWFGTYGGISRYDSEASGLDGDSKSTEKRGPNSSGRFVNFTSADGLVNNHVTAIHQSADGAMWFGTWNITDGGGGVSRYDGNTSRHDRDSKQFVNFTPKDGLASNHITAIHQSADGAMWFGTYDSGVSLYDGVSWSSLDTRDGLAGNVVRKIHQGDDGSLWFGTDGGLTVYRRRQIKPRVHIVSVEADRIYHDLSTVGPITIGTRITIEYNAIDFLTHPDKRQYRVRLRQGDKERGGQADTAFGKPKKRRVSIGYPMSRATISFRCKPLIVTSTTPNLQLFL